jgi:hypothetical protein
LEWACYQRLGSPVARRLYRLLTALHGAAGSDADGAWEDTPPGTGPADGRRWRAPLERWAERLPLAQRYPSHLQRVLTPAHDMLTAAGIIRSAAFVQEGRAWWVTYDLPAAG